MLLVDLRLSGRRLMLDCSPVVHKNLVQVGTVGRQVRRREIHPGPTVVYLFAAVIYTGVDELIFAVAKSPKALRGVFPPYTTVRSNLARLAVFSLGNEPRCIAI